jgi:hypothetical protein
MVRRTPLEQFLQRFGRRDEVGCDGDRRVVGKCRERYATKRERRDECASYRRRRDRYWRASWLRKYSAEYDGSLADSQNVVVIDR